MSIRGRELYIPARLTRISFAAHASLIQMVGLLDHVTRWCSGGMLVTDRPTQKVMSGEL